MPILVGIDGTSFSGGSAMGSYMQKYANSYVREICLKRVKKTSKYVAKYIRGPAFDGTGLLGAAYEAHKFIKCQKAKLGGEPVFLTGFSRGAAGVVQTATWLKSDNINVDAMILFDCVDRHLIINSSTIPDNVKNIYHAIRSPGVGSRKKLFGYSGMYYYPQTTYYYNFFRCTHGAVGGLPETPKAGQKLSDKVKETGGTLDITYSEEMKESKVVWTFAEKYCKKFGFFK